MRCSTHPERSAPCSINWILAGMYGIFLVLVIILAIISAKKLRKVKKQIENEFLEATKQSKEILENKAKNDKKYEDVKNEIIVDEVKIERKSKPRKIIVNSDTTLKNKRRTRKTTKSLD